MRHAGGTAEAGARVGESGGQAGRSGETVQRILTRLRDDVGADRFARYFRDQARVGFDGARLDVTVPTGFVADLVGRRFGDSLRKAARAELPTDQQVEIKIRVDRSAFLEPAGYAVLPELTPATPVLPPMQPPLVLERRQRPGRGAAPGPIRHRLEDYVVGESNRMAYSAAERLADPAGQRCFSPLFIHGGCGLGKTHLLQGIAARWREHAERSTVRYTTAEAFTNEYVQAVRAGRLDTFRKAYRGVNMLCIDDVQFLASKTATQGELLHTFDAIDLDGARVVLASDEHPRQIARLSAALVSRFMSGMVVRLDPPEPALRERIVTRMAERRGLRLDKAAIACLAADFAPGSSVRDLEGALTRVEALARLLPELSADSSTIGVAHVRRALGAVDTGAGGVRTPRRPMRIDLIRDEVCRFLRVEPSELMGKGRHKRVVLARSLIAHLARTLTTMSYPEIARALGRPNHSTIVTACKRVQEQMARNETPDLGADLSPELAGLTLIALADLLRNTLVRAAWGGAA